MSPLLTQEQKELEGLLRRFFSEEIPSSYVRSRMEGEIATDPALWKKLEELGVMELFSGEGSGLIELSILAIEAGRVILPEYLVDRILGGPFLFGKFKDYLSQIGFANLGNLDSIIGIVTNPKGEFKVVGSESPTLEGKLSYIPTPATNLLLNLLEVDQIKDINNWFLVNTPPGSQNLPRDVMLDRTLPVSEVSFASTKLTPLNDEVSGWLTDAIYIVRACELSGLVQQAVNMTAEYIKTRKQFGVPVGGFQALQHRMADMYAQSEALRSLATFAAWAFDTSVSQRSFSARSAIIYACEVSPKIVEGAIQLHGGIGFTWEHDLHLYLRRVRYIEARYKDLASKPLFSEQDLEALKKASN